MKNLEICGPLAKNEYSIDYVSKCCLLSFLRILETFLFTQIKVRCIVFFCIFEENLVRATFCELDHFLSALFPNHHVCTPLNEGCTISLITGWTVHTEKYKARGLYEGLRDLYLSV